MNFISSEPGGIFYTVNLYIRSHRRSFISPALLYHLNARFLSQSFFIRFSFSSVYYLAK